MSLAFDETRHEYRWNGRVVPSVTQVLRLVTDYSTIPTAVLEQKRALGVAIHAHIAAYNCGELDESETHEDVAPYLDAYKRFLAETGFEPLLLEEPVYSEKHGYAGTLDLWGVLNGEESLVDIKSSSVLHPATGLQTAAYQQALHESLKYRTKRRYGLQLRPDGTYHLHQYRDKTDFLIFLNVLAAHNWKEKHHV